MNRPWEDRLADIQGRVHRIFDQVSHVTTDRDGYTITGDWPAVDIIEEDAAYRIEIDLPGIAREAIEIHVENNILSLAGERKRDTAVPEDSFRREERSHGRFERTFTLPRSIDATKIDAKLKDGVLRLSLPKAAEATPHKIVVS